MTTNTPAERHQGPETLCARFTAFAAARDLDGIVGLYADDAPRSARRESWSPVTWR